MKQFQPRLDQLEAADSLRSLRFSPDRAGASLDLNGRKVLNLASNDYLGLANHPTLKEASIKAIEQFGCGSTASRLVSGNLELNNLLEKKIRSLFEKEAALVFPTGYMTNLGIISSLAETGDLIFSDKINHASIVDGIALSKAEFKRYAHRDMSHLERLLKKNETTSNKFIITDTIFSMDGDLAPLKKITDLCKKYDAFLIIDEAHANGILGDNGLGLAEETNLLDKVDLVMGTFSKALGSLGGFVTGKKEVIDFLINKARSLIFTTGLPPAVLAANIAAMDIIKNEPERREKLLKLSDQLRTQLHELKYDIMGSASHIIPIHCGTNETALTLSQLLFDAGFLAVAIRPPTVPVGSARLRISLSAEHTEKDIASFLTALTTASEKVGGIKNG